MLNQLNAQEIKEAESRKGTWIASIVMANTHVPSAALDGRAIAIVPTWGTELAYHVSDQWLIAYLSDLQLQSFEVDEGEVKLERHFPWVNAIVGKYNLASRWTLILGPGIEIEKNRNLFVFKTGVEYVFEVNRRFEIGLNLNYENKEQVYDSWAFGVAFSKILKR
jgi:hypothetical protein